MVNLNFKFVFVFQENYGKQAILKIYNYNGVKYSVGTFYDTLGEHAIYKCFLGNHISLGEL